MNLNCQFNWKESVAFIHSFPAIPDHFTNIYNLRQPKGLCEVHKPFQNLTGDSMRTSIYMYIITLLCAGLLFGLYSQAQAQELKGAPPGSVINPEFEVRTPGVNPFVTPADLLDDESIFNTTVFSFGEVVLFSYTDNTELSIVNNQGTEVLNVVLNQDEYQVFIGNQGIYRIFGSNSFTALVGDATQALVHGWYAVDQSGRGTSTLFNTYMMGNWTGSSQPEQFIVAAYENNTDFTIRNLDTGALLSAGVLNAGEFFTMPNTPYDTFLQVQASKPVSALSYADTDYYVPSSNGTFIGTFFLGYSSFIGGWTNSVTVTGYYDDTEVTVYNAVTDEVLAEYTLNEGQVNSLGITSPTYWRLESDKPVTAGNIPYAGWTGNYWYKTRAVDSTGFGAGTLFYMPTIGSRIDVFSFENENAVTITRLGGENDYPYNNPQVVFEDMLDAGEGYTFSSPSNRSVYKIESDQNVSVIQSNGGAGAEFMPLSFTQNLPDLAVSSDGIHFDPEQETYDQGEEIEVTIDVFNFGPIDAESVLMHVHDGDPEGGGLAPLLHSETIPVVQGNSTESFSFTYTVPNNPEFRQIVVIADPNNAIIESNNANNKAYRFIVPNDDLLPPIAVTVEGPAALGLDDELELFPNPFDVTATLLNTGDAAAEDVTVELILFDGLSLEDGDLELSLGTLGVGESVDIPWTLSADPEVTGSNRYTIRVDASNAESKDVNRNVTVPSPLPGGIEILMPAPGEEGVSLTPMLAWSESQRAASYILQLSHMEDFSDMHVDESGYMDTDYQVMEELEENTFYYWRVRGVNHLGEGGWAQGTFFTTGTTSLPGDEHPKQYQLAQNYPNPFNPTTMIRYALPEQAHVTLSVYTIMGERVAVLANEVQSSGWHQVSFDATRLSSGVYLYQLKSNNFVETRRMMLIK